MPWRAPRRWHARTHPVAHIAQVAIAWTAINILMSNYLVRYTEMTMQWLPTSLKYFSALHYAFEGMAGAGVAGRAGVRGVGRGGVGRRASGSGCGSCGGGQF